MLLGIFLIFIVRKGGFKKFNIINFQVKLRISINSHVIKICVTKWIYLGINVHKINNTH